MALLALGMEKAASLSPPSLPLPHYPEVLFFPLNSTHSLLKQFIY